MKRRIWFFGLVLLVLGLVLGGCRGAEETAIEYDGAGLRFSGEAAMVLEEAFVLQFPNRNSGTPAAVESTAWLQAQMEGFGLTCSTDEWEAVNFSEPLPLKNVICQAAGQSDREIVIVAHHDQSPETIYGADNDGSGIAVLLHLAQLFGGEAPGRYTLTFLASDGEEYGMLGTGRFVETHPDLERIIAAVSLDNVGKELYDGLDMSPIGQFNSYGPAWLLRLARESVVAANEQGDDIWVPRIRDPFTQLIDQAVPISFMDQGPLVAAGVPAFGFAGAVPAEFAELHYETYHAPGDTMELQSAETLHNTGRATEALVRQLQTMDSFPQATGPYLYFEGSDSVLSGPALWLILGLFVLLFGAGAVMIGRRAGEGVVGGWRAALPHFLGLWLPLVLAVILLYLLTALGLLQRFERYFALPKDPAYTSPRWPAVILFVVGLGLFLYLGRRFAGRWLAKGLFRGPSFKAVKSLSFLVIGLAAVYIALFNPFSMLLIVPLFFWLLIGGRRGGGLLLDVLFFILGGALLIYMFYTFGFLILRIDLYILWYVLMMMAVPMVGLPTMMVVTAVLAAGLAMVVRIPAAENVG